MTKHLRQTKKHVFETLKYIMKSYDNEVIYSVHNKENAMIRTCEKYYDFYEWLQKLDKKPKKTKSKIEHNCQLCKSLIEKGFCTNKECIAYSPVS